MHILKLVIIGMPNKLSLYLWRCDVLFVSILFGDDVPVNGLNIVPLPLIYKKSIRGGILIFVSVLFEIKTFYNEGQCISYLCD